MKLKKILQRRGKFIPIGFVKLETGVNICPKKLKPFPNLTQHVLVVAIF